MKKTITSFHLAILLLTLVSHLYTNERLSDHFRIETWQSNLQVPWQIVFDEQSDRSYFTERTGKVRVIVGDQLQKKPWANIDVSKVGGEGGLLGLALSPQKTARNENQLYIAHTYGDKKIYNRLVLMQESKDANGNYIGSLKKVVLQNIRGGRNHNGGVVKIGPDRHLYWAIGDRYQENLAQDKSSYQGKILRMKLDGQIPNSNPFKDSYVYSLGHRNPQGLAFSPFEDGVLLSTEHGPSGWSDCCRDEINLIKKGGNYGWPIIRGSQTKSGLISPLIHSGEKDTWAPGGAVFISSGPWKGQLFFVGLRGQALYRLDFVSLKKDSAKVKKLHTHLKNTYGRIRDVARDYENRYYLLTSNKDGRGNPKKQDDKILRLTLKNNSL